MKCQNMKHYFAILLAGVILGLLFFHHDFKMKVSFTSPHQKSIDVIVNNTILPMLKYLSYLSTLCFNLEQNISWQWDTLVFKDVMINQYIKEFRST